ncbi:hypothetical protein A2U01_0079311, partial [Trifolium medium]|nr:hypothetical protein [Trifolium medium]
LIAAFRFSNYFNSMAPRPVGCFPSPSHVLYRSLRLTRFLLGT